MSNSDVGNQTAAPETSAPTKAEREPFLAFVPKVAGWAGGIVGGEVSHATKGVASLPTFLQGFMAETFTYYKANPRVLWKEVISGFTVAIMQVPESIAFAFVAGVPPVSGLHATFWMATITGILGGKPGMISGAAGALAVVVTDLTSDNGVLDYLTMPERLNVLYMTMFVCGIAQIVFAWFRLAKLVKLIPETGMIGFMNGLAIIIFSAQLPAFQKCEALDADGEQILFTDCTLDQREWLTFSDDTGTLLLSLLHVAICMAIMQFFGKVPYLGAYIPASLVSLLFGTLIEWTAFRRGFDIETRTVGDTTVMSGDLPSFDWPEVPKDSNTINTIIVFGITLAAIGGVESVLTLQACNEITDTVPEIRDSNQELFAQGLANLACGLFRAMGGDAMIGQSTINIANGARHRVSSTMSGLFMLLFVVAISGFIELIPIATLTGVLFIVVLNTFQWHTFSILRYGRMSDSAVILIVTIVAVFFNLAVAIAAGVIFSALVNAWDSGEHVEAEITIKPMLINGEERETKYVKVIGTIFFGSARKFINMFNVGNDPETVVIDLHSSLVVDHSAVAAIQGITHRFKKAGKTVLLTNVPDKSHGRLRRAGDHDMLDEQITPSSKIVDIEGKTLDDTNDDDDDEQDDVPRGLGDLKMLHNPELEVEVELTKMASKSDNVTIEEKKDA